jgi:hypothetical protein
MQQVGPVSLFHHKDAHVCNFIRAPGREGGKATSTLAAGGTAPDDATPPVAPFTSAELGIRGMIGSLGEPWSTKRISDWRSREGFRCQQNEKLTRFRESEGGGAVAVDGGYGPESRSPPPRWGGLCGSGGRRIAFVSFLERRRRAGRRRNRGFWARLKKNERTGPTPLPLRFPNDQN